MASKTDSARAVSLALEKLTGTAVIDGEVVDLPPREFALLLELAARPGVPVHGTQLIEAIWAETPGMTSQDLYVLISKLRKRIGDPERGKAKLIQTQRGFRYFLALPGERVVVADRLEEAAAPVVIDIQDPESQLADESPGKGAALQAPAFSPPSIAQAPAPEAASRPWTRVAVGVAALLLAVVGSWSAGYLISSQRSGATPEEPGPVSVAPEALDGESPLDKDKGRGARKQPRKEGKGSRGPDRKEAAVVAAVAPPSQNADQAHVQSQGNSQATSTESAPKPPPAAPSKPRPEDLPPAPTRFLYHLFNSSSGDHFVTTDGNVASQYHARGYEGGAVGRIYTSAMEGTRAVSTNQGTAYIFVTATPKTEPSTRAVALWYSTNNAGDFFYSVRESEAKQPGWSARVVGYVGTL